MTMTDRERDFEARFAHDLELKFRIDARRNKLVGLWAAEKLGLSGEEAHAYAQAVMQADFRRAGPDDVLEKIQTDFQNAGIHQSEHQIRRCMTEFLADAERQIMSA